MTQREDTTEILALLHAEYARNASALSDRQFSVTVQVVTLHLAIMAGVVLYSGQITTTHRIIGVLALAVFDLLAAQYVFQKASAYWFCHDTKRSIEAALLARTGLDDALASNEGRTNRTAPDAGGKPLSRGFRGSLFFYVAILVSGLVAIIALSTG